MARPPAQIESQDHAPGAPLRLRLGPLSAPIGPAITALPGALLPVLDKPWIVHVVERLATRGAREIRIVDGVDHSEIARVLGDGQRWGVRIAFGPAPAEDAATKIPPALEARVLPQAPGCAAARPPALEDWSSYAALSHPSLLRRIPDLMIDGREVEPGVILSRNVEIHPSARIVPPVFLGRNVRIERRAEIGPHAVIQHTSLVSRETAVRDAVILPESFIGEGLVLSDMIAAPGGLFSLAAGAAIEITDAFLIGHMRHEAGLGIQRRWWPRSLGAEPTAAGQPRRADQSGASPVSRPFT